MSDKASYDPPCRYRVTVEGSFVASHQVPCADGRLEPLHEHDWRVEVTFAGSELDDRGVLIDFGEVSGRLRQILAPLEGAKLNDLAALDGAPPTAEVIAAYLFAELAPLQNRRARLQSVRVRESPGCSACYAVDEATEVSRPPAQKGVRPSLRADFDR